MSGHSQFANIKHRKDAQDSKRGKIFQKITKEIHVAVKMQGSNPESNPKLRLILDKARSLNMPKDNINRAIAKASNQNDDTNYESIVYEGYGPSFSAFIVHCLTDNKNRTASNVRSYFTKSNGKLGTSNSVQYLFEKTGILEFNSNLSLEEILEMLLEFDLLQLDKDGDLVHIEVNPNDLSLVTKTLRSQNINEFVNNEIINKPLELISIVDEEDQKNIFKLLDLLENDDDVQTVEINFKK